MQNTLKKASKNIKINKKNTTKRKTTFLTDTFFGCAFFIHVQFLIVATVKV